VCRYIRREYLGPSGKLDQQIRVFGWKLTVACRIYDELRNVLRKFRQSRSHGLRQRFGDSDYWARRSGVRNANALLLKCAFDYFRKQPKGERYESDEKLVPQGVDSYCWLTSAVTGHERKTLVSVAA
jgi:hypothetical protein